MKDWGRIRNKYLCLPEPTSEAITPIVGTLLMSLILFLLAGAIAICFFNIAGEGASSQPLMAKISLESCEGGLSSPKKESTDKKASFGKNKIILVHQGGSHLPLNDVSIRISGDGNAYQGIVAKDGHYLYGNTQVIYENLSPKEKNTTYAAQNAVLLKDGIWSAGERLILHGRDSGKYNNSSVKVGVNGDYNTSDNYGFKAGSEITLKVIDVKSGTVIAEQRAIVKHAEK